ncbi:MAG: DUF1559 domain-containing protein [Planctomycetota bacterium]
MAISSTRPLDRSRGFTLVELLVVIAIIGVLVALLLPAVQSAREAARRIQCQNNLKQMALAALNYESTNGTLPPGCKAYGDDDTRDNVGTGWAIEILPYFEQAAIYDRFDFSGRQHYRTANNREAALNNVASYVCPSDPFAEEWIVPQGEGDMAWASYKAVAGTIDLTRSGGNPRYWDRRYNGTQLEDFPLLRGALPATGPNYVLQPTKIAQITDGTSQTALMGEWQYESTSGLYDPVLAEGQRKSAWASPWRYHSKGHFIRGSVFRITDFDQCLNIGEQIYGAEAKFYCYRSFASFHNGLINFALCDGSVTSLSEDIDEEVYLAYGTIGGGLDNGPINASAPGPPPPPPPTR